MRSQEGDGGTPPLLNFLLATALTVGHGSEHFALFYSF